MKNGFRMLRVAGFDPKVRKFFLKCMFNGKRERLCGGTRKEGHHHFINDDAVRFCRILLS